MLRLNARRTRFSNALRQRLDGVAAELQARRAQVEREAYEIHAQAREADHIVDSEPATTRPAAGAPGRDARITRRGRNVARGQPRRRGGDSHVRDAPIVRPVGARLRRSGHARASRIYLAHRVRLHPAARQDACPSMGSPPCCSGSCSAQGSPRPREATSPRAGPGRRR